MKIFALIAISLLCAILIVLAFYIVLCTLLFRSTLSRRCVAKKLTKAITSAEYDKYLIDHSWWDKQDVQTLQFTSFDGVKLVSHFIDRDSDKIAILVHGYGGCYKDLNPFADFFLKRGYSVLAVECRAHGNSEGDMVGMGWLDRIDLKQWIDLCVENRPTSKIVLFGQSMGASTVCMTLGEKLPKNVILGISDCAFDNVYREFYHVGRSTFKVFTKPILSIYNSYLKRSHGFDIKQADAVKQLKNCHLPVLFIHGKDDNFVPPIMTQRLSEAIPEHRREVLFVEGANHIMSYPVAPKTYLKTVDKFLQKYNM